MKDMQAKKSVLKEIIDLMTEKDGEMLRKHPKIAKVDIESNDPMLAKKLARGVASVGEDEQEEVIEEELDADVLPEFGKMLSDNRAVEDEGEDKGQKIDDEEMTRLMELYKKLV